MGSLLLCAHAENRSDLCVDAWTFAWNLRFLFWWRGFSLCRQTFLNLSSACSSDGAVHSRMRNGNGEASLTCTPKKEMLPPRHTTARSPSRSIGGATNQTLSTTAGNKETNFTTQYQEFFNVLFDKGKKSFKGDTFAHFECKILETWTA